MTNEMTAEDQKKAQEAERKSLRDNAILLDAQTLAASTANLAFDGLYRGIQMRATGTAYGVGGITFQNRDEQKLFADRLIEIFIKEVDRQTPKFSHSA